MKFMRNRIISNTIWLLSERIISIAGLFLVTSAVAKYIGPANFGKVNTAILYFSVLQAFVFWGSDTIGVKLISKFPMNGVNFLRSFALFKVISFFLTSVLVILYFYFEYDRLTFIFSLAVGISTFFVIIDYFNTFNEATLRSHINVIANVIGLSISFGIRYIIVEMKLSPEYLSIPIVAQGLIPFVIRFCIFKKNNKNYTFFYKPKFTLIKYGISSGFGLVISTVSVMVYLNVGRVLLSKFDSMFALGIYSVAIALGTSWSFVNSAIIASLTPMLYGSKKETSYEIASFLSMILILVGGSYFILFLVLGKYVITHLYGEVYSQVYSISLILIPVTILSSLGVVAARYIISQGGYKFEAKKSLITAIFTIFISWLLIMKHGIYGAAWGALLCEMLSLTVINYFYNKAEIFTIHLNIFNIPKNIAVLKSALKTQSLK
ncbi:polysaccharide biosynthesis C-terminal domain-containing protein [Tatumella sp. UCD-D_suzukii]|uniref:polysaccharide biosynthesis C-terminal domain-containing protein n=1 Tax=Tatumella sp. UCD-D_suzukii TaxID=1408192 RepID=UPI0004721214|nr:polysaccharide biosynthesis C-terminal domain-containing protein [Tatumella sp. UCD-D_suzukii]